jgi:hypothetical protein
MGQLQPLRTSNRRNSIRRFQSPSCRGQKNQIIFIFLKSILFRYGSSLLTFDTNQDRDQFLVLYVRYKQWQIIARKKVLWHTWFLKYRQRLLIYFRQDFGQEVFKNLASLQKSQQCCQVKIWYISRINLDWQVKIDSRDRIDLSLSS